MVVRLIILIKTAQNLKYIRKVIREEHDYRRFLIQARKVMLMMVAKLKRALKKKGDYKKCQLNRARYAITTAAILRDMTLYSVKNVVNRFLQKLVWNDEINDKFNQFIQIVTKT